MRIDSHQHFWKYNPVKDSWIDDTMDVLKRDFLPEDLEEILGNHQIDGCIAIQADQSEKETEFLLSLAAKSPFIKGVVGWVDLTSENASSRLAHYTANPLFKGVRHILQAEQQDDFMLNQAFLKGIEALSEFRLTYDLLVLPKHLKFVLALLEKFPDQPFVIDHMAKPLIKDFKLKPWQEEIAEIANHPNVYCKLSGAITEADWHKWNQIDIFPYFDVIYEAFGPDRLMFGSDWPVCNLAGSYGAVCTLLDEYMKQFPEDEKSKIWGGNTTNFYNLNQWTIWKNEDNS